MVEGEESFAGEMADAFSLVHVRSTTSHRTG